MTRWLVFGATGAVGRALLAGWRAEEAGIDAVSRRVPPPPPRDGLRWLAGDLDTWQAPSAAYDAVLSVGPLDWFARWYDRAGPRAARVIAVGSTSVHSKLASPDPDERDLAAPSRASAAACASRGAALTVLRPTLIYGVGGDRNLSRFVAIARRWGVVPLPRGATGRRQPVHAADVAGAVLAAVRAPAPVPGRFDLPGGETLPYDEMVRRTLAAAAPSARLWRVPDALFHTSFRLARAVGAVAGAGEGMVGRLGADLVYDGGAARAALGVASRPFAPTAAMFEPPA